MCCYELYLAALGFHQIALGVHQIAQGGRQAVLDEKDHQTALGCRRIALEDHALYKPESQRMQWQSHINQEDARAADSSTVHILAMFVLKSNTNRQGYGQSLLLWRRTIIRRAMRVHIVCNILLPADSDRDTGNHGQMYLLNAISL